MEPDYIAGLFDGEGAPVFTLSLNKDRGRKCLRFYAWVVIDQSHDDGRALLVKVKECLDVHGINSFYYPRQINVNGRSYGEATTWKISNLQSVLKFVELMRGRVILKAERLEMLGKIVKIHLEREFKYSSYSEHPKEIYSHYRKLAEMWDSAYKPSGKSRRIMPLSEKLDIIWSSLGLPK